MADVKVGATRLSLIAFVADLFLFHAGGLPSAPEPQCGGAKLPPQNSESSLQKDEFHQEVPPGMREARPICARTVCLQRRSSSFAANGVLVLARGRPPKPPRARFTSCPGKVSDFNLQRRTSAPARLSCKCRREPSADRIPVSGTPYGGGRYASSGRAWRKQAAWR